MRENPTTARHDSYATVSFALAVLLLVFPVMADVAVDLMFARLYWLVALWMAACYGLVIYPWLRSIQRHNREPGIWGGNGRLFATGVVLALHVLMHVAMVVGWWMDRDS